MKTHEGKTRAAGFSLIEVTIAMAIAAVAMVTLLGMIPQGMNTMTEAGDQAIMGRIHQQLLNEIQLTPFGSSEGGGGGEYAYLEEYNGEKFFYDSQGEELSSTMDSGGADPEKGEGSFAHIYTARITIPVGSDAKLPESLGGGGFDGVSFDGDSITRDILPVIVEVAAVGGLGKDFKFDDEENFHLIESYQSMIVKMGRNYKP